jgi:hypothetical protein
MTAYDSLATQNRSVGIDSYMVFNGWVALGVRQRFVNLQGAQGYAMKDFHVVADPGRCADDNARTMVDNKSAADLGGGVNIDAGLAVGIFSHHAGQQRDIQAN